MDHLKITSKTILRSFKFTSYLFDHGLFECQRGADVLAEDVGLDQASVSHHIGLDTVLGEGFEDVHGLLREIVAGAVILLSSIAEYWGEGGGNRVKG